jgi:tetratricopeptide (TPR) repeat protein
VQEAGEYYQKCLEVFEQIYQQTETAEALRDVIIALDRIGDNKHAKGFYDEARTYRLKARELCEQYVKLDPSAEEWVTPIREKAIDNGTEE